MNIEDVISQLGEVIAWARANNSPVGYFPALYRSVTIRVSEGIRDGEFMGGPRMGELDAVFAARYLSAFEGWRTGRPISKSWKKAFDEGANRSLLISQHLLAGINAHINLDLGIAAAMIAPGEAISGLEGDFSFINQILSSMVEGVENDLSKVSPWMGLLDFFGGKGDEEIVNFSIGKARKWAWTFAQRLAVLDGEGQAALIAEVDAETEQLCHLVVNPPGLLLSTALFVVRQREEGSVARIIDVLSGVG